MNELSSEALAVIEKVKKLLALANNNPNENEATAASAKAMELLAAYNLDMAVVGKTAKGSQRSDNRRKGGLYGWQRDLWKAVAELNFCMYWSIKGLERGSTYEHRILGSHANVVSTEVMADYLQQTVERLAQEWAKPRYNSVFVREAIAYREGMATRLVERLNALRRERIAEDERKRKEQPTYSGGGNALVLLDVINSEHDLNEDYIYGLEPGTTAKKRAEQEARRAAAQAKADEAFRVQQEWDAAHPVEAAARKAAEKKELEEWWAEYKAKEAKRAARRKEPVQRYRAMTPQEQRAGLHSFGEGMRKANDIGLERQVDADVRRGIK